MPVALAYSTPPTASGEFTLELTPYSVTLRFPLMPKWVRLGSPAFIAAVALLQTVGCAWMTWRFVQVHRAAPLPMPWAKSIIVALASNVILWWALAIFGWLDYRRWCGWSRSLYADAEKIVWSSRGLWRARQRTWRASSVAGVTCTPVYSLPRTKAAARITIRFRDGRSLRLRIISGDRELPTRLLSELNRVLGLECNAAHERGG